MKRIIAAALAATFTLSAPALAHEFKAGELDIIHPMAYETAPSVKAGGGYMRITNTGSTDDALIGVKADFPKVMIHQTVEEDGIARMMHVERLDIPAGETVVLEPGGYHVMFMGLSEPLEAGSEVPATLIFEKAGEVEVMFNVEERGAQSMSHSH